MSTEDENVELTEAQSKLVDVLKSRIDPDADYHVVMSEQGPQIFVSPGAEPDMYFKHAPPGTDTAGCVFTGATVIHLLPTLVTMVPRTGIAKELVEEPVSVPDALPEPASASMLDVDDVRLAIVADFIACGGTEEDADAFIERVLRRVKLARAVRAGVL